MAHEVVIAAYAAGLPRPMHERSWGGVFHRASSRQNIVRVGRRSWRGFQQTIADDAGRH